MLGFIISLGVGVLALLIMQKLDVECLNEPRRSQKLPQTGLQSSWKPVAAPRIAPVPVKSGAKWQEDRLSPLAQR